MENFNFNGISIASILVNNLESLLLLRLSHNVHCTKKEVFH